MNARAGYQYHQDLGDEHEGFAPGTRLTSYRKTGCARTALSGIKTSTHCNSLTRHDNTRIQCCCERMTELAHVDRELHFPMSR